MASLPLINWRLTESTRPASTSGSILCGIFKGAFCAGWARGDNDGLLRHGPPCGRAQSTANRRKSLASRARRVQESAGITISPMTLKQQDLEDLSRRTLDHYDRGAEGFWKGTRDHDVSQNIAALLRPPPAGRRAVPGAAPYPQLGRVQRPAALELVRP